MDRHQRALYFLREVRHLRDRFAQKICLLAENRFCTENRTVWLMAPPCIDKMTNVKIVQIVFFIMNAFFGMATATLPFRLPVLALGCNFSSNVFTWSSDAANEWRQCARPENRISYWADIRDVRPSMNPSIVNTKVGWITEIKADSHMYICRVQSAAKKLLRTSGIGLHSHH